MKMNKDIIVFKPRNFGATGANDYDLIPYLDKDKLIAYIATINPAYVDTKLVLENLVKQAKELQ